MTPYTPDVLREHHEGGLPAARTVVPLLLKELPHVQSVIDVGCGLGTWASQFLGIVTDEIQGIDGPWVPLDDLVIPRAWFLPWDLRLIRTAWPTPSVLRYDLALCLEVAEHLPADVGPSLVGLVCKLAPVVFWSAAVPGQGGLDHQNEQPMAYWEALFRERGYQQYELPGLAETGPEVHPWYRNARLYERPL